MKHPPPPPPPPPLLLEPSSELEQAAMVSPTSTQIEFEKALSNPYQL
jgi:hypothetical protein